jgi:nitrate/nitrite-specific signal transduction histidine kinase
MRRAMCCSGFHRDHRRGGQLLDIAKEGIINAFRHAKATRVGAKIEYEKAMRACETAIESGD